MAISPDGTQLVYEQSTPEPSYDLMRLALRGGQVSPLLNSPSDERNASISPDGRWIAYDSNQTDGRSQIYVRPFPNVSDAVRQISTDGGRTPLWAASGRELFFVSGSTMMAATIQFVPGIRVGSITPLFEAGSRIVDGRLLGNTMRTYDVSRDGQRFLMMKDAPTDGPAPPAIVVVQNWFEELRSRLPAAK
jgi:serine/threonine-protein kinase